MSRREILIGAGALLCAGIAIGGSYNDGAEATIGASPPDANARRAGTSHLARLEKHAGGRLGVLALNTANGHRIQHRTDERFPLCSTFKYLAAAAILERVDQGKEHLDRWLPYGADDLLEYAPYSKEHIGEGGMKLSDACAAAVELSDNTAANLILKELGGPEAVTQYCRSLGDPVTRLDRTEPFLNVVVPGDLRDITTPTAMVNLLNAIFCGKALSPASHQQLETWMLDAKVGEKRLPAGLPPGWKIGHKTGTGDNQVNDVGIIWPPGKPPILVAAFYIHPGAKHNQHENVLREVGAIVAVEA